MVTTGCTKTWFAVNSVPVREVVQQEDLMRSLREIQQMGHFDPEKLNRISNRTRKTER